MSHLEGAKVLVTGAGGFIGSHLVEFLCEHGAAVTALFRYTSGASIGALQDSPYLKEIQRIFGDIRDPETCARSVAGQNYIFHLAAQVAIPYSYLAPRDYLEVNAMGTVNLMQAAMTQSKSKSKALKRFVLASTSEVYGTAKYTPIDESHPLNPQSPYAASKVSAEKMAESYFRSFDFPITIVRSFNTYGPRQSPRAVIPTIITQALVSRKISLGATSPRRDFLYVADSVKGLVQAAGSAKTLGEVINICSGKEISVSGVVTEVEKILGQKLTVNQDSRRLRPKSSEVTRLLGDRKQARKLCGFAPVVSFSEGLRRTIEFFQNRPESDAPKDYRI